jgi:mannose-1-phosphate guanylyltransferase/phosphomannomutase
MAFVREEYRRAHGGDIGELIYPGRVLEQFVERLERAVDRDKTSGATIVVDFCGGVAGLVASRVFSRLGVSAVVMEGFANAVGQASGTNLEESIERIARSVPTVAAAFGPSWGQRRSTCSSSTARANLYLPT